MFTPCHMSAARFRHLMRHNKWTIRELARIAGVTMKRVRSLRLDGIYPNKIGAWSTPRTLTEARADVWGWTEILERRHK